MKWAWASKQKEVIRIASPHPSTSKVLSPWLQRVHYNGHDLNLYVMSATKKAVYALEQGGTVNPDTRMPRVVLHIVHRPIEELQDSKVYFSRL